MKTKSYRRKTANEAFHRNRSCPQRVQLAEDRIACGAEALETLGRPAASILSETGRETDLAAFSSFLAESLFSFRLRVRSDCGTAGLRALWAAESFVTGKNVELSEGGSVLASGLAAGFGPGGELLLETAEGVRLFHSGDVSLRTRDSAR